MRTRVWAPRGSRPTAPRQTDYEACYLFGAFFPATGEKVGLVLPHSNAEAMNLLLEEIARSAVGDDEHVVLVLDNAGWHHARALEWPPCITALYLPPYSPELNAAEIPWGYLKGRYLANQVFTDYDALVEAGCRAWNALTPDLVKSLTHREWAVSQN